MSNKPTINTQEAAAEAQQIIERAKLAYETFQTTATRAPHEYPPFEELPAHIRMAWTAVAVALRTQ